MMVSNSIRYLTIFFSYTGWLKLLNISKQIVIDVYLFNFVRNYILKKSKNYLTLQEIRASHIISWNTLKLKQNAVKI